MKKLVSLHNNSPPSFVFNIEIQQTIISQLSICLWNKLYLYPIFSQAQQF